jgi:hypothetical protein
MAARRVLLALLLPALAWAGDAAAPGRLTEELPTLKCLGVRWLIGGDANGNATVQVRYRKAGAEEWQRALDLFRVDSAGVRQAVRPPSGTVLHAGSIFGLEEDTAYEVKLTLADPDGGGAERTLTMRTWSEPKLPQGGPRIDVKPGGLRDALAKARRGDTLVLQAGVYRGLFRPRSGEPGKPIALVGEGEVIFDGEGGKNCIDGSGMTDLMLEGLRFRNATWALAFNGSARITVRRCTITDCEYGFVAQNRAERISRIFLADNVMRGPSSWPRTKGIESARGIQVAGQGNVVCHNRISHFADAIDTFSSYPCSAIDIYANEISECTDDGIEMDYSEHNTRCFDNRLTNVFQGISVQPVQGGPVYVFRNALYNVVAETFKMHNAPSGALFFHNTSVKAGMPLVLYTGAPVTNFVTRNNLFIGTTGNYGYETTAPMRRCDFDHDGFGGEWKQFLKWNGQRYRTMEDARERAPVYRHVIRVRPAQLFASGLLPPADPKQEFPLSVNDLRLRAGAQAVDAGVSLHNINDGFAGKAPDLGAYELGATLPHYGPRPR